MADNKLVYQSYGTGLYDAIYSVYGKTIVDNIFDFSFERGDFKFSGYLCKPTFSKSNRTYQTLIINGRYVINQTISTAIYKAYENFIMKGTFPFFVINLSIPLDKIDVNVHPNKLDVKFENNNELFGLVYTQVSDILFNINNTKSITLDENATETFVVDKSQLTTLDKNVGSEYKPNENFSNIQTDINNEEHIGNMKNFRRLYRTMTIEETISHGIGTCIEQVNLMSMLLNIVQIKE